MKRALNVSDLIQTVKKGNPIELTHCQQHVEDGRMNFIDGHFDIYLYIVLLGFDEYWGMEIFACYKTETMESPTIWFGHLNDGTY